MTGKWMEDLVHLSIQSFYTSEIQCIDFRNNVTDFIKSSTLKLDGAVYILDMEVAGTHH